MEAFFLSQAVYVQYLSRSC